MTTGSQVLRVCNAALRFVQAQQRCDRARARWKEAKREGRRDADALRAAYRSCAAQMGGYHRGLLRIAQAAIDSGIDVPEIHDYERSE